jgi:hypothetical protein
MPWMIDPHSGPGKLALQLSGEVAVRVGAMTRKTRHPSGWAAAISSRAR